MSHEQGASGALVLERDGARTADRSCNRLRRGRRSAAPAGGPAGWDGVAQVAVVAPPAPTGTRGSFRSPCLLLVAGAAIYLGYRSTGVITTDGTPWAVLTTGWLMPLVEGACLLASGLLLTRPVQGHQDRGRTAVAASGIVVLLASVVVAARGGRSASDGLGIAELAFAAVAIGVVVGAERHRQRGFRRIARSGR